MSIDLTLEPSSLADLLADAAMVRLPAPRAAAHTIDLRTPEPHPLEIPAATISLVEGYADSHL